MKRKVLLLAVICMLIIAFSVIHISAVDLVRGDMNDDSAVTSDDAIYLLRHTLSNNNYPIFQNGDVNRDGAISSDDAIYLLRYTLSNTQYPIGCEVLDHVFEGGVCKYCGIKDELDITVFASTVNYDHLGTLSNGAALQGFYKDLDIAMTEFHNDAQADAQTITVNDNLYYCTVDVDYSDWGITKDQAVQAYYAYIYDHPLYYWLNDYLYTDSFLLPTTFFEYGDGVVRESYNQRIYGEIEKYIGAFENETSLYRIAAGCFDLVIDNCDYANLSDGTIYEQAYAECSVIGSLLNKKAYNSGYAKLYQMLLNYFEIENKFVWSNNPLFYGWNLAKLDDGKWYWFDLALADKSSWDKWDSYSYFCGTSTSVPSGNVISLATFTPHAPELSSETFSASGVVNVHSNFVVNNVKYKLINGSKEVIVVDYNFANRNNINKTVTYNGIIYSVIDLFEHNGQEINSVLFETDTGYDYLGTLSNGSARQMLYEELDVRFTMFHFGESSQVKKETVSGKDYYEIAKVNYAKYGLSFSDAITIWQFYRNDHPLYYWLYYGVLLNDAVGCIYPYTASEYDTVQERLSCNELVYDGILEYIAEGDGETNPYLVALSYYDAVIDACAYAYDSSGEPEQALWSHSILGAFQNQSFVCEGYAKLLQLLMNYSNIENRYICGDAGGPHAWNLARMDDGRWYWIDATWGDSSIRNDPNYMKYFCGTNTDFSTHTYYPSTNSSDPARVIPPIPTVASSKYSNTDVIELGETFTVNGCTYRRLQYDEVECISGMSAGEALPETVAYNGHTYKTSVHSISNQYWYHFGDQYMAFCSTCNDWVTLYEVTEKTLELNFEENIETELAKYEGFKAVSPSDFNRVTMSNGSKALACGNSPLYIDIDRGTLADMKVFAITFDLTITQSGNAYSEISILSLLSNFQNGAAIQGKTVDWGWFLKYNTQQKKLTSVKSSSATLGEMNSISVELNTTYKVTVIFDTVLQRAYIDVNGNTLGMTTGVTFPDLSDPKYDNALSLRFNDGGNCAPIFDNLRIAAIN